MVWRMILTMSKDKVISLENNAIQWNYFELFHKEIFNTNCYSNLSCHFVMGHNTFRNFKCLWPGQYYVLTNCYLPNMNSEISNVRFVTSIFQIPKNEYINTWFIGGKSIYESFVDYMDEIISIQIGIDTNEMFKNLELKKIIFELPEYFKIQNKYTEYIFENGLGRNILKKTIKYKNTNVDKKEKLDEMQTNLFAVDPHVPNVKYKISTTIDINMNEGFPLYDNFNLEFVFNEMWSFLNGSCNAYLFCNHFGLQCVPKTSEISETMTLIERNKLNINTSFINQIQNLCNYFHVPANNLFISVYKPLLLEYDTARAFEVQLLCIQGNIDLIYYLPQMNEIIDKPFVVMGLSFLLFSIVHYLNENRTCLVPVCYKPGSIKIIVGKLFYYIEQENFSKNYRMVPLYMPSFKKNLTDYSIYTDFIIKW